MRDAASLGYLLARTSDTLADSTTAPVAARLHCLDQFQDAVAGKSAAPRWPVSVLKAIPDPRERYLLDCSEKVFIGLNELPPGEGELVRDVLKIIASGQALDLERFAGATRADPVALRDDAALEDYAWRVAGCVGAFWTKLGFHTLSDRFSLKSTEQQLLEQGIAYGKGLQLVNILRDVAADLAVGRCYLPVADPRDPRAILDSHARWLHKAEEWVSEGDRYARTLRSGRLRAATVLPALIASRTLEPLRGATWEALQIRTRVPRWVVYRCLMRAFFLTPAGS